MRSQLFLVLFCSIVRFSFVYATILARKVLGEVKEHWVLVVYACQIFGEFFDIKFCQKYQNKTHLIDYSRFMVFQSLLDQQCWRHFIVSNWLICIQSSNQSNFFSILQDSSRQFHFFFPIKIIGMDFMNFFHFIFYFVVLFAYCFGNFWFLSNIKELNKFYFITATPLF